MDEKCGTCKGKGWIKVDLVHATSNEPCPSCVRPPAVLDVLERYESCALDDRTDRLVVATAVQAWHEAEVARWAERIRELEDRLTSVVMVAQGKTE